MNNIKRKNLYIPVELDNELNNFFKKYNYNTKKEMFIELLELGLLKYDEDYNIKNTVTRLINKIDHLLAKMEK